MPAAAIPAISAGGAIGSGLLNYFRAKNASKPNPIERQAQQTQTNAANQLSQQGAGLSAFGMPKLQQAGNYFSTLAGGNRAAIGQAVAPDAQNINSVYGGTQRTLNRFLRGPDRDFQTGELARQRASGIGSLFTGARTRGVAGLTEMGQFGASAGASSLGGAAGIAGQVGSSAMSNRYAGADLQRQAGSDTAGFIFQLLKSGACNPRTPSGNGFNFGPAGPPPVGGGGGYG
jgi:hypothetical protein